jgi:F-type H+-transporting ATPase subunit epsilon
MSLSVRVITPYQTVWDNAADSVIMPIHSGEMGILSGHVPFTAPIATGVMRICTNGKWMPFYVTHGFAQLEDDCMTVLVNDAERGDLIDPETARSELESAQLGLERAQTSKERFKASAAIARAKVRLKAASWGDGASAAV